MEVHGHGCCDITSLLSYSWDRPPINGRQIILSTRLQCSLVGLSRKVDIAAWSMSQQAPEELFCLLAHLVPQRYFSTAASGQRISSPLLTAVQDEPTVIKNSQWINLPVGRNLNDHVNVRLPNPSTENFSG